MISKSPRDVTYVTTGVTFVTSRWSQCHAVTAVTTVTKVTLEVSLDRIHNLL